MIIVMCAQCGIQYLMTIYPPLILPLPIKPTKVVKLKVKWKHKKRKALVKWKRPKNGEAKKFQVRISKPNETKVFKKWKKTKSLQYTYKKKIKKGKKYKVEVRGKNGQSFGSIKGLKFKTEKKKNKTFGPK